MVRYIGQDADVDVQADSETTAEVEVSFMGVQAEAPDQPRSLLQPPSMR